MNEEIRYYLRYHPHWYIVLSRYPQEYGRLVQEYRSSFNADKYVGNDDVGEYARNIR